MKLDMEWRALDSSTRRAHLVARERWAGDNVIAWCGAYLTGDLAPYDARCQSCLAALEAYVQQATVPPPLEIEETVSIVIRRPADSPDTVEEYLRRTLSKKRSWTVASAASSTLPVWREGVPDEDVFQK